MTVETEIAAVEAEDSLASDAAPAPVKPKKGKAKKVKKKSEADSRKTESVNAFDYSLTVRKNCEDKGAEPKPLRRGKDGLKDSPFRSDVRNNTFRIAMAMSLPNRISENVKKKFPKVVALREKIAAKKIEVGGGYSRTDLADAGKVLKLKTCPGFAGFGTGSTRFAVIRDEKSGKAFLYYPDETNPKSDRPKK
tara:strand:+ start:1021 stop:1599 length:579 start_codon:yes stop_codon:yes gene_type:complete